MAYRKEQFVIGDYYHVLNRGIDGRDIFNDTIDYKRFLESLKEFNTPDQVTIQLARRRTSKSNVNRHPASFSSILCYCLLPNHFHLLLKQLVENGISEFMRKLEGGYTKYFNIRHKRKGHLFQGPFKAVRLSNDAQFLHISRYIHLNVLDLFMPSWREGKIQDWGRAKRKLEEYPWSSYPMYVGRRESDFCHPELLGEIFKDPEDYEKFVKEWTERSLVEAQDFILETSDV